MIVFRRFAHLVLAIATIAGFALGAGPDTWSQTGTMTVPLSGHTATLLGSGQVVAAGGCAISSCPTATSETYDPQSAAWTSAGNLQTARQLHTQTSLQNGQALVVGGCGRSCSNATLTTAERFNAISRMWSPAGQLHTGRYNHAAVLLRNGTVLVTGGISVCNSTICRVTATAEIYNPAANAWTATTNLSTPRLGHTMTLLGSGMVLVTGGCALPGTCETPLGAEVYDPQAQTWTPTGPMTLNRSEASATLLANGQVLVAGGLNSGSYAIADAELFNPQTGKWTATGSMTTTRAQPSATLLADGTVLAANGVPTGGPEKPTAELYNPASGQWVDTGSPSTFGFTLTRLSSNSVLGSGGTLLNDQLTGTSLLYTPGPAPLVSYSPTSLDFGEQQIAIPSSLTVTVSNVGTLPLHPGSPQFSGGALGDYSASGSCVNATVAIGASCTLSVVFTPSSDGVRTANMLISDDAPNAPQSVALAGFGYTDAPLHWIPAGSMSTARDPVTLARLPNGNVLAAGGAYYVSQEKSADIYNAATNSWSPAPPMSSSHLGGTATNLADGRVLIAGGGNNVAEIYNPKTNQWLSTGPMTQSRQYHAATLLRSGKVLVTGGCTGSLGCASTAIYDPAANAWTPAAALLTARAYHTSTLLKNGQVLIAGGTAAGTGTALTSAELYDPAQNTFTSTGSMQSGRVQHTASLLASGDVLAAGGFLGGRSAPGSAEIYTPSTGLWTATGAMQLSRLAHTATVLPSGAVLVAGGEYFCDSDDGICSATNAVEIYDEHTAAWTLIYSMLSARESHGAALLNNGGVLVAGGDAGNIYPGAVWSSAEQFVP